MTALDQNKMTELKEYMATVKGKDYEDSYLIAILHKAQDLFGYLHPDVMNTVAYEMDIPTSHIWGVASFYHYFNLEPVGKHIVSVCMGTACYVKGADKVLARSIFTYPMFSLPLPFIF